MTCAPNCTYIMPHKKTYIAVKLLSRVRLFVTLWTTAHQAPLSLTISWSLLKLTSIKSVMLSNHLFLCCPHLSSCPQSFPESGSFPMIWLFVSGGQSTEALALGSENLHKKTCIKKEFCLENNKIRSKDVLAPFWAQTLFMALDNCKSPLRASFFNDHF